MTSFCFPLSCPIREAVVFSVRNAPSCGHHDTVRIKSFCVLTDRTFPRRDCRMISAHTLTHARAHTDFLRQFFFGVHRHYVTHQPLGDAVVVQTALATSAANCDDW